MNEYTMRDIIDMANGAGLDCDRDTALEVITYFETKREAYAERLMRRALCKFCKPHQRDQTEEA